MILLLYRNPFFSFWVIVSKMIVEVIRAVFTQRSFLRVADVVWGGEERGWLCLAEDAG